MKASELHRQGYTCGQAIIKKYNEDFNENIDVALGSGMGIGFGSQSMCGAVSGACVVLSLKHGSDQPKQSKAAILKSKSLISEVNDSYQSEICQNLKANKVNCSEIIDFVYDKLKESI